MILAMEDDQVRVASDADIGSGVVRRVVVGDDARVLVRLEDGSLHALDGICTHQYAELADGEVEDDQLWCPLHSSGFDVRTGAPSCPPALRPLQRYPVVVRDGEVYVGRRPAP